MIAYLATVSSAPPPHGGAYTTSPVRIGVALEDQANHIVAWGVFLIDPPSGTFGDPAWMSRYGVTCGFPDSDAIDISDASVQLIGLLASARIIVAHHSPFHSSQLRHVIGDSLAFVPANTLKLCTLDCAIPASRGKMLKAPKLTEALEHYTGAPLNIAGLGWMDAGLAFLNATRINYWGSQRLGIPPDPIGSQPQGWDL
jgi:hypothetical protein